RFRAALSSGDAATAAELATPQFLALPGLLVDQAKGRSLKAVETLLDLGLKVDVQNAAGVTALHQAAWNGDLALIDFLLTRGARTNLRDTQFHCTAVSWALESGQAEAADRILDRSDDVFDLVGAARLSQLEALFSSSPDLATTLGHAGNSPLHALRLVNEQTASVIALLRRCGANPGLPNDAGLTPGQAAEANHRWELEDLLT
ncbi:MAG: ankyrin repeat domain-containing protein, partial [Kofleriaceae bacterium]|nr:ankyrin repeat domain-containing protein [Kofleriaceae bacterium]